MPRLIIDKTDHYMFTCGNIIDGAGLVGYIDIGFVNLKFFIGLSMKVWKAGQRKV